MYIIINTTNTGIRNVAKAAKKPQNIAQWNAIGFVDTNRPVSSILRRGHMAKTRPLITTRRLLARRGPHSMGVCVMISTVDKSIIRQTDGGVTQYLGCSVRRHVRWATPTFRYTDITWLRVRVCRCEQARWLAAAYSATILDEYIWTDEVIALV